MEEPSQFTEAQRELERQEFKKLTEKGWVSSGVLPFQIGNKLYETGNVIQQKLFEFIDEAIKKEKDPEKYRSENLRELKSIRRKLISPDLAVKVEIEVRAYYKNLKQKRYGPRP